MEEAQQIHVLINTLQESDRNNQLLLLKEIATCIQHASLPDLKKLLLFVSTTNDVEIMLNLFKIFTVITISNKKELREAIITNTVLYHKLQNILQRGLPYKCCIVLNLITALVYKYNDENTHDTLSEFAKKMSRVSGCLKVLTESFVNIMMHPDTWKALCVCISECCRDNEMNQEYCSHLIPVCIDRGQQGDGQVLLILYSLLNGNRSNCERYVSSGGCQMFTRERLDRTEYLKVLGSLVDSAPDVVTSFSDSEIPEVLREILHAHGPRSQIGQWCNVILYYVDLKKEENSRNLNEFIHKKTEGLDNTSLLYENVIKEIVTWNTNAFIKPNATKLGEINKQGTVPFRVDIDSKLKTQLTNTNKNNFFNANDSFMIKQTNNTHKSMNNRTQDVNYADKSCQTVNVTPPANNKSNGSAESLFLPPEPQFHSTPIHRKTKLDRLAILDAKRKLLKDKLIKKSKETNLSIDRTVTSKIFRALNESCSTVVKIFKNIIPDTKFDYPQTKFKKPAIPQSSNYSFTKYMKKRDSILENSMQKTYVKEGSLNMCDTCNDTEQLKRKLRTNVHLRKTVDKLKIGINMYGCNFQKLSKTFWPNEPYMTPIVLYNLYRKLILK